MNLLSSALFNRLLIQSAIAFISAMWPALGLAAEANSEPEALWWNLVIAIIVLSATFASAALPLAALKQWPKSWRLAALFPLIILVIWLAVIIISRLSDPDSHRLWAFEVFSWAMLNMIYMVAVMTYKRQIDKADQAQASQSPESSSDQAS